MNRQNYRISIVTIARYVRVDETFETLDSLDVSFAWKVPLMLFKYTFQRLKDNI